MEQGERVSNLKAAPEVDTETGEVLPDATISMSRPDGTYTDPIPFEEFRERVEAICQPTLDPTIFPAIVRRQVPMVKITFTGSVDMEREDFEAYCAEGLEPGRVVKLSLTGYLPDPHAKWVKRTEDVVDPVTRKKQKETWWEQEGAVKIKALELGSFELSKETYDGE